MNRKTQTLTVNFRNPNVSFSAEKLEEGDYENAAVFTFDKIATTSDKPEKGRNVNAAVCIVDQKPATADKKSPSFTRSFPTITVSWLILFVIVALRIYFTSVISENNAKLTAEKMNLEKQNQELETQNQELEMEKRNLTNQIKDMEAKGNELNISRAQWSIDAYCPKDGVRKCKSCQPGWNLFQSSCYLVFDYESSTDWKTWEEARELCKRRSSDLVVVDNAEEKTYVSGKSWKSSGNKGYWIGLKAEDGKWKWVDGSDLADSSWIENPTDGHCAISVTNDGWKSVNCNDRNRWICEQKALSV